MQTIVVVEYKPGMEIPNDAENILQHVLAKNRYLSMWITVSKWYTGRICRTYYVLVCQPYHTKTKRDRILLLKVSRKQFNEAVFDEFIYFQTLLYREINLIVKEYSPQTLDDLRWFCKYMPDFMPSAKRLGKELGSILAQAYTKNSQAVTKH